MPVRIQRRRTRGWKTPPGTMIVTRPGEFGNPYVVVHVTGHEKPWWVENDAYVWFFMTRSEAHTAAAVLYRAWLEHPANRKLRARAVLALKGRDLACWCPLTDGNGNRMPCHADVLLEIANA